MKYKYFGYETCYCEQTEYELTLGENDLKDHYDFNDPLFTLPQVDNLIGDTKESYYGREVFWPITKLEVQPSRANRFEGSDEKMLMYRDGIEMGTLTYSSTGRGSWIYLKLIYPHPINKKEEEYEITKSFEGKVTLKDAMTMLQNRMREKIPELINFRFNLYKLIHVRFE